jgi:hypothetical protein
VSRRRGAGSTPGRALLPAALTPMAFVPPWWCCGQRAAHPDVAVFDPGRYGAGQRVQDLRLAAVVESRQRKRFACRKGFTCGDEFGFRGTRLGTDDRECHRFRILGQSSDEAVVIGLAGLAGHPSA